jgi:Ca-activated chloride channel homolog
MRGIGIDRRGGRRLLAATALVLLGLLVPGAFARVAALAATAENAATTVEISSPRAEGPVFGKVTIEARVTPPAGAAVLKVEIFVDGRLLATALDAPFRAEWDAGEGIESHLLRARAYTSDGAVSNAEMRTTPRMGVERARVLLVEVYATVKTEDHRFLNELRQDVFSLSEDGKPQSLSLFTQERKPVHVVLLLDVSASMRKDEKLTRAAEAARLFVEALDPNDRVALVTFSDDVKVLVPFTGDKARVFDAIAGVQAQRGTALYDAVYAAADLVGREDGRKAIVLLSDGQDLGFDTGPGSSRKLEEAIEETLRQQVTAFTIGLGENLGSDFDFYHQHSAEEVLTRLASDTGGQYLPVARPGRLRGAFDRILDELRFQYTLAYHPSNDRRDGTWRSISVSVSRPHAVVSARKGYFAPTE